MFSFKEKFNNKLIDKICPIGEKALKLCEDEEDSLLEIIDEGAKIASIKASTTLAQMKQ